MSDRVKASAAITETELQPLAELLSRNARLGLHVPSALGPGGAALVRLCGFSDSGEPLICASGDSSGGPTPASTTVKVSSADVGRDALVVWTGDDPVRPVIVGLLEVPTLPEARRLSADAGKREDVDVVVDGRRLCLTGEREVVLRCGKASITLTSAGKVVIKGAYVSSHSTGVNRVKGGSVQIN